MNVVPSSIPRVRTLVYRVPAPKDMSFWKAEITPGSGMGVKGLGPPDDMVARTHDFIVTLSGNAEPGDCLATVEMLANFSAVDDARNAVEPFLRAWEIESLLERLGNYGDLTQPIRFQFESAVVDDPIPKSVVIQASAATWHFAGSFPPP